MLLRIFVILVVFIVSACSPDESNQRHLIMIVVDDLGWSDVSYHGSEIRTPNIDALAETGVRLERFYATPICVPTRVRLMTGRWGIRYNMIGRVTSRTLSAIPEGDPMLAEILADAGYQTAMIGKWHIGGATQANMPLRRGFEQFYGFHGGQIDYYEHRRPNGKLDWLRNDQQVEESGYVTDLLADEAVRVIEQRDTSRPLFLYVAFSAPHTPVQAPPKSRWTDLAAESTDREIYAGMVGSLDHAIGRISVALRQAGMQDQTLLLWLSDNGANIHAGGRNTPFRGGKRTAFEGGIRVPAIVWAPAWLGEPRISDAIVSSIDLLPSILEALKLELPAGVELDGQSRWSAIRGSAGRDHKPMFFADSRGKSMHLAVIRDPWKLVREFDLKTGAQRTYLFNLSDDPYEQHDLVAENHEMAAELQELLADWYTLRPAAAGG